MTINKTKYKQMKKIILSIVTLIVFASCTDYLDVNDNPNAFLPEDITSEQMIRGVMLGNQFWQTSSGPRIAMIWMNQGTGSDRQYISFNDWNSLTASSFDTSWGNAYRNSLFHASIAYDKAMAEGNPNLAAVAQIIKANALGTITSLWGDVPYSETFNDDLFPNPKFDSQLELYPIIQDMLQNSIVLLESGSAAPINNDVYFNGSKANWMKLAHALKARYYLHVKNYPEALNEMQNAFTSQVDDLKAIFLADAGANNPFYTFQEDRTDYLTADNSYAWDLLKSSSDRYRGHAKTNEVRRHFFNYTNQEGLNFSGVGKFGQSTNLPLVTYGEMLLIKAECETRINGLSSGVAALNDYRDLLKSGYGIGPEDDCFGNPANCDSFYAYFIDSDFESGGIENEDGVDSERALLREIYEERYVFFIGSFEALVDFGRTNNIAEIQLKDGNSGTPQRLIYPQSEINANTSVPSPIPSVTEKTPVHQ